MNYNPVNSDIGTYTVFQQSTNDPLRVGDPAAEPSRFNGEVEILSLHEVPDGIICRNIVAGDWS